MDRRRISMKEHIKGANPYLPLWEHIPDGEPRLFTYKGEKRLYVYGSHDTLKDEYCGTDYVVWSAPADDLTDWRFDGVCYKAPDNEPLYAPDVVEKDGVYYMYAAEDRGSRIVVASSESPAGPFRDPVVTELGFDPGVLVDDDGRVYAYWGFTKSWCAELESDMATIKKGTVKENILPHCVCHWNTDTEHADSVFEFFEASSLRKIGGKYVLIYSKRISEAVPELGYEKDTNSYLAYAYSDSPLGGWQYGGILSCNAGEMYKKPDGTNGRAYPNCNNHGSIVDIDGQWYVFYHRKTGENEYSRQGMLEPIDAAVGSDGKVYIGAVTFGEDGEPVKADTAEMTSQGAYVNGVDAYGIFSAGYACCLIPSESGERAYIKPVYEGDSSPVVGIKSGTVVGFKYMQFGSEPPETVTVKTSGMAESGGITVRADSPDGAVIAVLKGGQDTAPLICGITGKRAVYFVFECEDKGRDICAFEWFTFNR